MIVESIRSEFLRYKKLSEGAMEQLEEPALSRVIGEDGNSIAVIVWHIAGNLRSRFTEFLTSDGEKPWRRRDEEFAQRQVDRSELAANWVGGWKALLAALDELDDTDLTRDVTIRGQPLTVMEALHRSLAHIAYHTGQIVLLARIQTGSEWRFLSIPPGKSAEYARNPTMERGPEG